MARNSSLTKKALLLSILVILMSITMLIGTTFAWFTDTASTSINTIKSGNLNVEIQNSSGESINTLKWIKEEDGTVIENQDSILWEPGCTYLLTPFKIVNTGNLSLKYEISISGINGDAKLNEAIEWTINGEEINLSKGHLKANETSGTLIIKGHMKDVGNEYQGLSIDGIAITVYATQDSVEYDSYNNTYDANAPVYEATPDTIQEILDNVEENAIIKLTPGNYGTLYFRQSENSELYINSGLTSHKTGTVTNGYVGYGANQSHVDALYLRKLNNIVIEGCDGATVDNINFMLGYYKYNQIKDGETISGNIIYEDYTGGDFNWTKSETNGIFSFFEINNLTFKNVTFSGNKTVLKLAGNGSEWFTVDGLHFVGCIMDASSNTETEPYFWSVGKMTKNDSFKNFSLEDCTIIGAKRVMSVCGIENLTITGNTFKNIKDRDLHIHNDGTTATIDKHVTGTVIISNNKSDGSTERFIRIGNASKMNLEITDNIVTNYAGKDNDYIKVNGIALSKVVSGNAASASTSGRELSINFADEK